MWLRGHKHRARRRARVRDQRAVAP